VKGEKKSGFVLDFFGVWDYYIGIKRAAQGCPNGVLDAICQS